MRSFLNPLSLSAVIGSLAFALPASASTLVQTVANSQAVSFAAPADGTLNIVAASFFNGTFLPFVGNSLQSAVLAVKYSFSGTFLSDATGGNASASFQGTLSIDGNAFSGAGSGYGNSGPPNGSFSFSLDTNTSSDLANLAEGPAQQALFNGFILGSSAFTLTYGSGGPAQVTTTDITSFTGTVTSTETLTYTYSGPGSLLALTNTPEPASFTLLATGVLGLAALRRRAAI